MTTAVQAKKPKGRGSRSFVSPNFTISITADLVTSLLKKHCRNLTMPTIEDVETLARQLTALRARIEIERTWTKQGHARYLKAQEAAGTLKASLLHIAVPIGESVKSISDTLSELDNQGDLPPEIKATTIKVIRDKQEALAVIETTLAAISTLLTSPYLPFPVPAAAKLELSDKWRDVLGEVMLAYKAAMRPNNPRAPLKVTREGPGGKFIADVMSYVTGEIVQPDTIQKAA